MITTSENMTAREREEFEQEKAYIELQIASNLELKRLEVEALKLETKWSTLLKVPLTIIKLPVYVLFGIAYIVSTVTKKDMPEEFWKFLK